MLYHSVGLICIFAFLVKGCVLWLREKAHKRTHYYYLTLKTRCLAHMTSSLMFAYPENLEICQDSSSDSYVILILKCWNVNGHSAPGNWSDSTNSGTAQTTCEHMQTMHKDHERTLGLWHDYILLDFLKTENKMFIHPAHAGHFHTSEAVHNLHFMVQFHI